MHVAHFHPPRAVLLTLIAAVLAIVITLAIATSLNDISPGSVGPSGQSATISRLVPGPPLVARSTLTPAGSIRTWVTNPFSPLLARPIKPGWSGGGRS